MSQDWDPTRDAAPQRAAERGYKGYRSDSDDVLADEEFYELMVDPNASQEGRGAGGAGGGSPMMPMGGQMGGGGAAGAGRGGPGMVGVPGGPGGLGTSPAGRIAGGGELGGLPGGGLPGGGLPGGGLPGGGIGGLGGGVKAAGSGGGFDAAGLPAGLDTTGGTGGSGGGWGGSTLDDWSSQHPGQGSGIGDWTPPTYPGVDDPGGWVPSPDPGNGGPPLYETPPGGTNPIWSVEGQALSHAAQVWDAVSQRMAALREQVRSLGVVGDSRGKHGVVILPQDSLAAATDTSQAWAANATQVFSQFSDTLDSTADDYHDQEMDNAAQAAKSAEVE